MAQHRATALVLVHLLHACGGEQADDPDPAPYGWHPVGTPVERPALCNGIQIANDSLENFYTIGIGPYPPSGECGELTVDDCTVRACKHEPDAATGTPPRSLGDVTITVAGNTLFFPSGEFGTYASAPLWEGTATIDVQTSGDELPPFQQTLVGPGAVDMIAPDFPPFGDELAVDFDAPLELTWSPGVAGQRVRATLAWSAHDAFLTPDDLPTHYSTRIECSFDAAAGAGTIPAEALREVPTEFVFVTTLTVSSLESSLVPSDGCDVAITAENPARTATGWIAYAFVESL